MRKMEPFEKADSLETFMRRQERLIKQDEKYRRLIIIPIIVIAVSLSVIAYNFTAGRINSPALQSHTADTAAEEETAVTDIAERINLNTATAEILDSLPGIGAKKADAIIEMRERMGGFRSVEDILNVDGIGEKILAEIKHMIYVETE